MHLSKTGRIFRSEPTFVHFKIKTKAFTQRFAISSIPALFCLLFLAVPQALDGLDNQVDVPGLPLTALHKTSFLIGHSFRPGLGGTFSKITSKTKVLQTPSATEVNLTQVSNI